MKISILEFDDPGASDDEPVKGVTMGHIRAWHDSYAELEHESHRDYQALESRLGEMQAALTLAEDVLSRAPFSTGIWPNGMHPQVGIEKIRAALSDPHSEQAA